MKHEFWLLFFCYYLLIIITINIIVICLIIIAIIVVITIISCYWKGIITDYSKTILFSKISQQLYM